jgi:hypothetical protein
MENTLRLSRVIREIVQPSAGRSPLMKVFADWASNSHAEKTQHEGGVAICVDAAVNLAPGPWTSESEHAHVRLLRVPFCEIDQCGNHSAIVGRVVNVD